MSNRSNGSRATQTEVGSRVRGMGCHEKLQAALSSLDQYRGTVVACRYYLPSTLARPEDLATLKTKIYEAVARVVLSQGHLQLGVAGIDTKNPGFIRLGSIDLRNHVVWTSLDEEDDFEHMHEISMQTQLDSRFDNISTIPGWRIVVLHKPGMDSIEISYAWNHIHHDGMGAKIFHESLLQNLNDASAESKESVLTVDEQSESRILQLPDPTATLAPNPEKLSSWPMAPKSFVSAVWRQLNPPADLCATWAPIKPSPYKTKVHNLVIDNRTVKNLIATCRKHHTTITGLIHALVLISLSSSIPKHKGFMSRTPYNLRTILPSNPPKYPSLDPKKTMCNYVSVVDHDFDAKTVSGIRSRLPARKEKEDTALTTDMLDDIWATSARIRREIEARLDMGMKNDMLGIMKVVLDWRAQQKKGAKGKRHFSWLITNIGVFDGGDQERELANRENWTVRRGMLVLGADTPDAAIQIGAMTMKGGDMCMTGTWQDCVVGPEVGGRLMRDLERWFGEIGAAA
ncbi:unnamed protein product [Periconia digitata]|uniref:Alcohol acetyltransferase n=1 Tax=Periconia digitata TaxID=1303443 RepID=A0A9W4UHV9_9PLEO|nr:unnamed protein product [Periconia digitata]